VRRPALDKVSQQLLPLIRTSCCQWLRRFGGRVRRGAGASQAQGAKWDRSSAMAAWMTARNPLYRQCQRDEDRLGSRYRRLRSLQSTRERYTTPAVTKTSSAAAVGRRSALTDTPAMLREASIIWGGAPQNFKVPSPLRPHTTVAMEKLNNAARAAHPKVINMPVWKRLRVTLPTVRSVSRAHTSAPLIHW